MDEAARKKYCSLLMFDIPPPSSKVEIAEMPLMIDCTTSLENSSIRAQDNFVFTSFVEPMRVKPQPPHIKSKNSASPSISNEPIFNNVDMSYGETVDTSNMNNVIIDESFHQIQQTVKKTPRPPNAFILYRRAKQPLITQELGNISNSKISKLLAKMWRDETDEEKLHWQRIADRKKMEHMQAHPGYVYRPKKTPSNNRRKRRPTKQNVSTSAEQPPVPESTISNVNPENLISPTEPASFAVSPYVFYDYSSYHHPFPYIFPQESMIPHFFLERPQEMNSGFNFYQSPQDFPQLSNYSSFSQDYVFTNGPYNNIQQPIVEIPSQEQTMFLNGLTPFGFDPFFNSRS